MHLGLMSLLLARSLRLKAWHRHLDANRVGWGLRNERGSR